MATNIDLGDFHKESYYRLEFILKKDAVAWTNASAVELTFEKPDRVSTFVRDMTQDSGATWYYDVTDTDLDSTGVWTVKVKITHSDDKTSKYPYEISLKVLAQP